MRFQCMRALLSQRLVCMTGLVLLLVECHALPSIAGAFARTRCIGGFTAHHRGGCSLSIGRRQERLLTSGRRHGPSSGPFDWILESLVPQPGPQWIPKEPPADALQEQPLPPEAVAGISEDELAWRSFLVALAPLAGELGAHCDAAELDFAARQVGDGGGPSAEVDTEAAADRAVRRAVWANLGASREAVRSLPHRDIAAARAAAWRGDVQRATEEEKCGDLAGLEAAITAAWAASCEPEPLWAAQALLGICRRLAAEAARAGEREQPLPAGAR